MLKSAAVSGCRLLVRQRSRIVSPRLLRKTPPASFSSVVATESSSSNLPSTLIDFQVAAKIEGKESHVATIELRPGETLRAESGAMLFMTEGIVSK
jgi:hypothetical protein